MRSAKKEESKAAEQFSQEHFLYWSAVSCFNQSLEVILCHPLLNSSHSATVCTYSRCVISLCTPALLLYSETGELGIILINVSVSSLNAVMRNKLFILCSRHSNALL